MGLLPCTAPVTCELEIPKAGKKAPATVGTDRKAREPRAVYQNRGEKQCLILREPGKAVRVIYKGWGAGR